MTPTIELLCQHRSIRHFTDKPITAEQREAIIKSAQCTSSSSFLQCTSIIRITDRALREALVLLTGGQQHVARAQNFGFSALILIAIYRFALMRNSARLSSFCLGLLTPH